MNKLYIIWLSIISFVLLIAVTVMITTAVSRGGQMMRGGVRPEIVSSQECTTDCTSQDAEGLRKNGKGQGAILKEAPAKTTTNAVPAN